MKTYFYPLALFLVFWSCQMEDPIPTYKLTTSISPSEGGKITLSPELPNYKAGEVVTLTPEPNEHWVFKQWDGDATGNTTPLQISMNTNKSITGVFVKRDYPLNIKIEGQGTVEEKIIPNPSGREYPHGTRVELKPIPKEGWVFESWGGDLSGNETPQIITVDKEKNVIVKFKRRDYPLNITITGEGTVEEKIISTPGGKTYPFETVVELKPVPKLGWVFESWGGDLTGNEVPKNINVDKEKNVTVKFKRKDYPLNVTISGEGTVEEKIVSSPGGRSYPYQTVVELAPKPKVGWVFEGWSGDLTGNEAPKNITVDKEKNVTAKFRRRDYPLNLTIEGEGLIEEKIVSSPGDKTYPFQTVVELTPKPKDGWIFESWGGDLTGNEVPKTITVDKEKNVSAKFVRKEFKINYTFTGEGTVEEKIISTPGGRTYPFQTVVELTPKPKEGWEFESWGGDLTGKEIPKNITLDKEKNVTVKFKEFPRVPAINTDIFPQINWNDHAQAKNGTYDINKDGIPDIITWSSVLDDPKKRATLFIKDYSGKDIFSFNIKDKNPAVRDSLNRLLFDYRDLNNDGYLDFGLTYMGEWDYGNGDIRFNGVNTYLLISKGNLDYEVTEILDIPKQSQFNLNIFDWDFDGLPDLLVSEMREGVYYKNLGNNKFEKRTLIPLFKQGIYNKYDYDKDGSIDFVNFYANQNTNEAMLNIVTKSTVINMNIVGKLIEKYTFPQINPTSDRITLFDGDGDGDMDLVIGSLSVENGVPSFFQDYFENTGTRFEYKKDFIEYDKSLISEFQVWCEDIDRDGDIDLYYPTYSKNRLGADRWRYFWWENTGNGFKINKKFKLIY